MRRLFNSQKNDWAERMQKLGYRAKDVRLQDFYLANWPEASTPIENIDFVALDFETTGLNADKDDIVSVGLVPFDTHRIYCQQAQHWIVKPKQALSEETIAIHGITHTDIQRAPDLSWLIEHLLLALKEKIVVVHCKSIERQFLDKALRDRIQEGIEFPMVDTMELEYQRQRRGATSFINSMLGKQPESIRLANSRRRYGLPEYTPHHALTDAIATAELLQAQLAHYYDSSTPISRIWG